MHRRAFVDVGALPAHDVGETEHEPRRMHRSAVTEIQRAVVRRHRHARARFVLRQPPVVRFVEARAIQVFEVPFEVRHLEWNGRDVERAAFRVVRVDVLGLAHAADFVDRIEQRARERDAAAARRRIVEQRFDALRHSNAPSAVASARAETDALGFEDRRYAIRVRAASGSTRSTARYSRRRRSRRPDDRGKGALSDRRQVADRIEPEADVRERIGHGIRCESRSTSCGGTRGPRRTPSPAGSTPVAGTA